MVRKNYYFKNSSNHYFYKNIGNKEILIIKLMVTYGHTIYISKFIGNMSSVGNNFIREAVDINLRESMIKKKIDDEESLEYPYDEAINIISIIDSAYKTNIKTKLDEVYAKMIKISKECEALEKELNSMTEEEILNYKVSHYSFPICHETYDNNKKDMIEEILFVKKAFQTYFDE